MPRNLDADTNAAIDSALGLNINDMSVDATGKFVLNDVEFIGLPFESTVTKMVVAGLQLYTDGSTAEDYTGGADQFNVETINGSGAILTMGFSTAGNEGVQNEYGDGNPYLIEGGPIGKTHFDDRFFVRDAELWGAVGLQTQPRASPARASSASSAWIPPSRGAYSPSSPRS